MLQVFASLENVSDWIQFNPVAKYTIFSMLGFMYHTM